MEVLQGWQLLGVFDGKVGKEHYPNIGMLDTKHIDSVLQKKKKQSLLKNIKDGLA